MVLYEKLKWSAEVWGGGVVRFHCLGSMGFWLSLAKVIKFLSPETKIDTKQRKYCLFWRPWHYHWFFHNACSFFLSISLFKEIFKHFDLWKNDQCLVSGPVMTRAYCWLFCSVSFVSAINIIHHQVLRGGSMYRVWPVYSPFVYSFFTLFQDHSGVKQFKVNFVFLRVNFICSCFRVCMIVKSCPNHSLQLSLVLIRGNYLFSTN